MNPSDVGGDHQQRQHAASSWKRSSQPSGDRRFGGPTSAAAAWGSQEDGLGGHGQTQHHGAAGGFNHRSQWQGQAASNDFATGSTGYGSGFNHHHHHHGGSRYSGQNSRSNYGQGQHHGQQQQQAKRTPKLTAEELAEYNLRADAVVRASSDRDMNKDLPGHPLRYTWVLSYTHRKPGSKIDDYNNSIAKVGSLRTVEEFWGAYSRLQRPNELPPITEYHFFKMGIQPIWEDNIHGGKWIIRLKKGISSRLWEILLIAMIGEQFNVGDEICGAVISVRQNEDILSLWTLHAEDSNELSSDDTETENSIEGGNGNKKAKKTTILKIRDTLKRVLKLPDNCVMQYKAHKAAVVDQSSFRNTETFK